MEKKMTGTSKAPQKRNRYMGRTAQSSSGVTHFLDDGGAPYCGKVFNLVTFWSRLEIYPLGYAHKRKGE